MEPMLVGPDPVAVVEPPQPEAAAAGRSAGRTAGRSPTRIALTRLRQDRVGMVCAGIFVAFVLIAIFAPLLARLEGQNPTDLHQDLLDRFGFPTIGPTSEHWFGVEPRLGRDLFARWVYGARPSLIVAGSVTVITTVVGVVVGLVAGFAGGWADRVLSWLIDFALSRST